MIVGSWQEDDMPSRYTLGARFEWFVKELVESGRYNNASEVVRDALRLLEDREQLREARIAELRRFGEGGPPRGLSDDDGETLLARPWAQYPAFAAPRLSHFASAARL